MSQIVEWLHQRPSQQNFEYRFLDSLKILEEFHFLTFVSLLSSKSKKMS
nr:MAG TPA: hypothetical protein [Caudoviricetes sp.]